MASVIRDTQHWVFDIPLIGDDMAKIGRIVDLWAQPCSPTAEIWVYGFFHAIPTLITTLLKPELIDIDIPSKRHKKRKGKRMKVFPHLIFRDTIISVPVPRWVVFRVYELGQRIGWYFLVADALEDFAINWMSMAYQWNGCDQIDPPPYWLIGGDTDVATTSGPGWKTYIHTVGQEFHKSDYTPASGSFEIWERCVPRFSISATERKWPLEPKTEIAAWRVRSNSTGGIWWEGETQLGDDGLRRIDSGSIPIGSNSPNESFRSEFYVQGGTTIGVQGYSWSMNSSYGPEKPPISPDP